MKNLGHFVDKRILTGCEYDRDIAAARHALSDGKKRCSEYGKNITRSEALRILQNPEQISSLRVPNVMSPDLIGIRYINESTSGPMIVEISAGEFMGKALYGVTVYHIASDKRSRDWDASKACHDLDEVLEAVRSLSAQ